MRAMGKAVNWQVLQGDVRERLADVRERPLVAVRGDGAVLNDVEAANFVEAQHVVSMTVREEDRIDPSHVVSQRLLAKIRGCVDQDVTH